MEYKVKYKEPFMYLYNNYYAEYSLIRTGTFKVEDESVCFTGKRYKNIKESATIFVVIVSIIIIINIIFGYNRMISYYLIALSIYKLFMDLPKSSFSVYRDNIKSIERKKKTIKIDVFIEELKKTKKIVFNAETEEQAKEIESKLKEAVLE